VAYAEPSADTAINVGQVAMVQQMAIADCVGHGIGTSCPAVFTAIQTAVASIRLLFREADRAPVGIQGIRS
jgi:hypothetical protein